jgi:hypothetical protein
MCDYNYEADYESAMREVRRLRAIVRDYSNFYNRVKEALDKKDWELIEKILREFE